MARAALHGGRRGLLNAWTDHPLAPASRHTSWLIRNTSEPAGPQACGVAAENQEPPEHTARPGDHLAEQPPESAYRCRARTVDKFAFKAGLQVKKSRSDSFF